MNFVGTSTTRYFTRTASARRRYVRTKFVILYPKNTQTLFTLNFKRQSTSGKDVRTQYDESICVRVNQNFSVRTLTTWYLCDFYHRNLCAERLSCTQVFFIHSARCSRVLQFEV